MDPEYYLCKRCGVNWEGAPGHPKHYCDSIFYPAEVKRLELQIQELQKGYAGFTAEEWFGKHGQLNSERLDLIDKLKESDRLNDEYKKAMENVVRVLGPKPPDCGCDGCFEEMSQALKFVQDALADKRSVSRPKCGPENYHCYNHDREDHGGHTVCCRCGEVR